MNENGYTRQEIVLACEKALADIKTFYQADCINYRGVTTDTGELYNEIVCEFICDNIELFKHTIPNITRESSYKVKSHDGKYDENSNRVEEITAIKMFNQSKDGYVYDCIGEIIDYQTPLKSKRNDIAGKIDLLSYDGKTLRVLELKKKDSKETMLRCVIEGYTYLKTANTAKLLADFGLPPDTVVKASPFVFKGEAQHEETKDERPQLKRLMALLESKPFYINDENDFYTVEE